MWRIKHKPTGLFYCPVKHTTIKGDPCKTNLSKNGKAYFTKPNPEHILGHGFNNPHGKKAMQMRAENKWDYNMDFTEFKASEWEVEKC